MTLPPNYLPVSFSADGKSFITTQHNANGRIFAFWDLNNKKQVSTFLSTLSETPGITAISPDGSQVAVAEDGQIDIYNTANGRQASSFSAARMPSNRPTNIAWSPDGKYLAEGMNSITIYDVQAKRAVATFGRVDARHAITALAWAPDSGGLVSAAIDNGYPDSAVYVWALS